jgi:hypothetical protein
MSTPLTVLIVALACVALSFYRLRKLSRTPLKLDFVPDPNNRKEVLARGWSSEEFLKILIDFQKLYNLRSEIAVKIDSLKDGTLRITFPQDVPDQLFPYLINYAQYPKGFEPEAGSILVVGKAIVSEKFEGISDPKLAGREAAIYVPSDDRKFDVLYIKIGDETFENSFARRKWEKVTDPRLPSGIATLL